VDRSARIPPQGESSCENAECFTSGKTFRCRAPKERTADWMFAEFPSSSSTRSSGKPRKSEVRRAPRA
jgi:hypothetical protein